MSGFFDSTSLPDSWAFAMVKRRCFLASFVSGLYFFIRRRSWDAWFLSIATLNWLTAGGDLRRLRMMDFLRCSVTYFGHLTTRLKSPAAESIHRRGSSAGSFRRAG